MNMLRFSRLIVVALGFASTAAATAADSAIESKVRKIFVDRCAECHGEKEVQDPTLDGTTNLLALRGNDSYVNRSKPEESELLRRVLLSPGDKDRMPQSKSGKVRAPLGDAEKALLKQWIEGDNSEAPRRFIAERDVVTAILADLKAAPADKRQYLRYFSLHTLHNQQPPVVTAAELKIAVAALSKLMNSLSWSATIKQPEPVGPDRVIYRIDLRDYTWLPAMWSQVASHNPYGFVREDLDGEIARLTGTRDSVWLRADWFVFACAQPPLYEFLLYSRYVPGVLSERNRAESHLENFLLKSTSIEKIKAAATTVAHRSVEDRLFGTATVPVASSAVQRAGFRHSGVSNRGNRLIERHRIDDSGRGYWKSYDFKAYIQDSTNDLFRFPLGPDHSGLSSSDRFAFRHDGGEMIFHLPNGFQGYMLTTAAGKILRRAPSEIVQDKNRPEDSVILNGISCIRCHEQGMKEPLGQSLTDLKNPLRDEVRPRALGSVGASMTAAERQAVENLYLSDADFARVFAADRARFTSALARAGAESVGVEPVSYIYQKFNAPVSEKTLTAELDIDSATLKSGLAAVLQDFPGTDDHAISIRGSGFALAQGIARSDFVPHFARLASVVRSTNIIHTFTPLNFEEFNTSGRDDDFRPLALAEPSPRQNQTPAAPPVDSRQRLQELSQESEALNKQMLAAANGRNTQRFVGTFSGDWVSGGQKYTRRITLNPDLKTGTDRVVTIAGKALDLPLTVELKNGVLQGRNAPVPGSGWTPDNLTMVFSPSGDSVTVSILDDANKTESGTLVRVNESNLARRFVGTFSGDWMVADGQKYSRRITINPDLKTGMDHVVTSAGKVHDMPLTLEFKNGAIQGRNAPPSGSGWTPDNLTITLSSSGDTIAVAIVDDANRSESGTLDRN
jgi:hypothetical protein